MMKRWCYRMTDFMLIWLEKIWINFDCLNFAGKFDKNFLVVSTRKPSDVRIENCFSKSWEIAVLMTEQGPRSSLESFHSIRHQDLKRINNRIVFILIECSKYPFLFKKIAESQMNGNNLQMANWLELLPRKTKKNNYV